MAVAAAWMLFVAYPFYIYNFIALNKMMSIDVEAGKAKAKWKLW